MATFKKHCRGCQAFHVLCNMTKYNSKGKCPCSQCIVKAMCDKYCSIWVDWEKNFNYSTRQRWKPRLTPLSKKTI